jgi:hypothetical protein
MTNSVSVGVAFSDPVLSGGTIDNTVIGATTKAAGSFTTVAATGATTGTTFSGTGTVTAINATAITAGGSAAVLATATAGFGVYLGSGAPTITAAKGSLYLRSDGSSASTRLYVNSDGATTWVAVTTAS